MARHPTRPGVLHGLGRWLPASAGLAGTTERSRATVGAARAAVAATPPGHVDYPRVLVVLGSSLFASYLHRRDSAALDEAVRVLRRAAGTLPPGHPDRQDPLTILALALSLRAVLPDEPDRSGVAAALDVYREVIRATPARSPDRPARLTALAISVNGFVDLMDDPVDDLSTADGRSAVEETVEALTEALTVLPPGRSERVGALLAVGHAHWLRFERDRRPEDGEVSVAAWREAADLSGAAVHARVTAARRYALAQLELHGPAAALDGYTTAVGLLPRLSPRDPGRAGRQRHRATVSGLAVEAAATAIAAGQPERAVELLEQARGVLWARLVPTSTDVRAVRAVDADLAREFERARSALDGSAAGTGLLADVTAYGVGTDVADRRAIVAERFDAVVARIRALPPAEGLPHPERFLRPTPWAELRTLVGDRDIVILTVSRWRADALVISGGAVRVVELTGLTEDRVAEQVRAYLPRGDPPVGPRRPAETPRPDGSGRPDAGAVTGHRTLSWLWETVAGPVLEALGRGPVDTGDPPRLWWCPTGPLGLLPLHAAGRPGEPGCSVLDRVVSSYLPTLRTLGPEAAPTGRPRQDGDDGLLVVARPDPPGRTVPPAVRRERRLLAALAGADPRGEFLSGPAATRAAVGRALARYRRVHLSCPATLDPADPQRSGLLLHDGLLSVRDLLAADRTPGDWIFLSGCRTAAGGLDARDGAVTLPAALSYAGWAQVVGTLWSVDDATATRVAELVLRACRPGGPTGTDAGARTLHRALRRLRDEQPLRTDRWAPYVHFGW